MGLFSRLTDARRSQRAKTFAKELSYQFMQKAHYLLCEGVFKLKDYMLKKDSIYRSTLKQSCLKTFNCLY